VAFDDRTDEQVYFDVLSARRSSKRPKGLTPLGEGKLDMLCSPGTIAVLAYSQLYQGTNDLR
jgi:hypothetical protein